MYLKKMTRPSNFSLPLPKKGFDSLNSKPQNFISKKKKSKSFTRKDSLYPK